MCLLVGTLFKVSNVANGSFFNGFVSSKFPINTGAEWSGTCKSNSGCSA